MITALAAGQHCQSGRVRSQGLRFDRRQAQANVVRFVFARVLNDPGPRRFRNARHEILPLFEMERGDFYPECKKAGKEVRNMAMAGRNHSSYSGSGPFFVAFFLLSCLPYRNYSSDFSRVQHFRHA